MAVTAARLRFVQGAVSLTQQMGRRDSGTGHGGGNTHRDSNPARHRRRGVRDIQQAQLLGDAARDRLCAVTVGAGQQHHEFLAAVTGRQSEGRSRLARNAPAMRCRQSSPAAWPSASFITLEVIHIQE